MSKNISSVFESLFDNFFEIQDETEAIIVSDTDGFIIAGKKREDIDMEIVSVLTTVVNPVLERIRHEFAFQQFGTASFDTQDHLLLFISIDEKTTLSLVLDNMASIDKISPYAYFLAEKASRIIYSDPEDKIEVAIPNFQYEAEKAKKLKEQIYQMRLDKGGIYRFKTIVTGDHEVGKTSIIRQFVEGKFSYDYRATIGLNILTHDYKFYNNDIKFSIWDIGAQSFFKRFRRSYYTGAQAAFIVYDVTNRESFEHIPVWYAELKDFLHISDIPIIIVGNKTDLSDQRVIDYQDGVEMTSKISEQGISNISYIETSALTGDNIEDAFSLISFHYITKSKKKEEENLKNELMEILNLILESKENLRISIITRNLYWNPPLQILNEVNELCGCKREIDEENKIYTYSNGLELRAETYEDLDVSGSDAVIALFDARNKEHIEGKWREIVIEIINTLEERKVALIGIRESEKADWSELLEEFDINQYLEKKMVSLMFFKLGDEYRLEVFDQLAVMLNLIQSEISY